MNEALHGYLYKTLQMTHQRLYFYLEQITGLVFGGNSVNAHHLCALVFTCNSIYNVNIVLYTVTSHRLFTLIITCNSIHIYNSPIQPLVLVSNS